MPIITTAFLTFILLILIGIAVGLIFNRKGRSWLGRQIVESTGAGDVTFALVGIAGSFMGYHVGVILELLPTWLWYITAVVGAILTIWLWRGRS